MTTTTTKNIVLCFGFRHYSPHHHFFFRHRFPPPRFLPSSSSKTISSSSSTTTTTTKIFKRQSQRRRENLFQLYNNNNNFLFSSSSSLNNNNNDNDNDNDNNMDSNNNCNNNLNTKKVVDDNNNEGLVEEGNLKLVQDQSELFDLYVEPPSISLYNTIVQPTPNWGSCYNDNNNNQYYPIPKSTGKVKERRLVHQDGDWHRSIDVWIVEKQQSTANDNNKCRVLLQRRSKYKDTHPNLLDVSCAGHVNSGEYDTTQTVIRELYEELGIISIANTSSSSSSTSTLVLLLVDEEKNSTIQQLRNRKIFTIASSIEGETKKYGKFICREYQDVFVLWWNDDIVLNNNNNNQTTTMEPNLFQPMIKEEVSGFEIMDGNELIQRLSNHDTELVPRSMEYINALAKAIGVWDTTMT